MDSTRLTPEHVVLITGFMCDARLFAPQIQCLEKLGISYCVEQMETGSSIRDYALSILDNSPENFALVGLSMGGIVAQEILHIAPQRVSHLGLLNTTPYADSITGQRQDHIRRVQEGEMIGILRDELKPRYLSPATSRESILPLVIQMGEKLGAEVFVRQSIALMTRKSRFENLNLITCPTVLITGHDDKVCTPDIHNAMAQEIPHSILKIIQNCGHLSTLEAPKTLNKILLEHWGYAFEDSIGLHDNKTRILQNT
jgi:pimeloyl-ACP methyl ester carboxylesterase